MAPHTACGDGQYHWQLSAASADRWERLLASMISALSASALVHGAGISSRSERIFPGCTVAFGFCVCVQSGSGSAVFDDKSSFSGSTGSAANGSAGRGSGGNAGPGIGVGSGAAGGVGATGACVDAVGGWIGAGEFGDSTTDARCSDGAASGAGWTGIVGVARGVDNGCACTGPGVAIRHADTAATVSMRSLLCCSCFDRAYSRAMTSPEPSMNPRNRPVAFTSSLPTLNYKLNIHSRTM